MPPIPSAGSRMHALTQEPSNVVSTISGIVPDAVLALDDVDVLGRERPAHHVSFPTTASIAARMVLVVKGLAMKLLSPYCQLPFLD